MKSADSIIEVQNFSSVYDSIFSGFDWAVLDTPSGLDSSDKFFNAFEKTAGANSVFLAIKTCTDLEWHNFCTRVFKNYPDSKDIQISYEDPILVKNGLTIFSTPAILISKAQINFKRASWFQGDQDLIADCSNHWDVNKLNDRIYKETHSIRYGSFSAEILLLLHSISSHGKGLIFSEHFCQAPLYKFCHMTKIPVTVFFENYEKSCQFIEKYENFVKTGVKK